MLKIYSSYVTKVLNDESQREATKEEEIDLLKCESEDEALWKDRGDSFASNDSESFDSAEEEENEEEENEEDGESDWIVQDSYTDHDSTFSSNTNDICSESYSSDNLASKEASEEFSTANKISDYYFSESEDEAED
jgi:hypothetical protein